MIGAHTNKPQGQQGLKPSGKPVQEAAPPGPAANRGRSGAIRKDDPVRGKVIAKAPNSNPILAARPFIIRAHLLTPNSPNGAPTAESTGSILSQTLDKKVLPTPGSDAGQLTLKTVRKLVTAMSAFARIHRFCTVSGTLITDENISLADYLAFDGANHDGAPSGGTPGVDVYYRSPEGNPIANGNQIGAQNDPYGGQVFDPNTGAYAPAQGVATAGFGGQGIAGNGVAGQAPALDMSLRPTQSPVVSAQLPATTALESANTLAPVDNRTTYYGPQKVDAVNAGTLSEKQWAVVLRNCAVFYGWVIDPQTRGIRRAPQAAFRLRSSASDLYGYNGVVPVSSVAEENGTLTEGEVVSAIEQDTNYASGSSTEQNTAANTETSAANDTTQSVQGPHASAIAQNSDAPMAATTTTPQTDKTTTSGSTTSIVSNGRADLTGPADQKSRLDDIEAGQDLELVSERSAKLVRQVQTQDQAQAQQPPQQNVAPRPMEIEAKPYHAIPNFRVNDDSKIEVTVCKSELALSMAKNDFSSQSTEASVSGGFAGITAGVSAGYASSKSSSQKDTSSSAIQTMVAKYMYPRCDLFMTAADLEPTPEFAALVEDIRRTKSILQLRKLQKNYGQLFCQQLTLGARLMSTKIMQSSEKGTEEEQKQQFKVSVGVSVNTPYGGASVKHEEERGSSTASASSSRTFNESNVFEATGGDTILADNPSVWATTVSAPETWRVIEREGLHSLVEMVSEMPGFEAVQSWFVQAIPAVSRFFNLDSSQKVTCRLKVTSPGNSLQKENTNPSLVQHYLAFHPDDICSPCLTHVDTSISYGQFLGYWSRMETDVATRLFHPLTYRSPSLRGINKWDFGGEGTKFGAKYNQEFNAMSWDIYAPFESTIRHGTRIILRTCPFRPDSGTADNRPPTAHMVVFRNAQGQFLPAMSDRDEYQYWRVLKVNASNSGEALQAGDEIRLCWAFSDQTAGFRDYTNDAFGRRQANIPPDVRDDVLFLKVPWPRFEAKGQPTALLMSSQEGTTGIDPLVDVDTIVGRFKYTLQDLRLRMDVVDNEGRGDSNDYLLKNLVQGSEVETVQKSAEAHYGNLAWSVTGSTPLPQDPLQLVRRMFGFGVFPF